MQGALALYGMQSEGAAGHGSYSQLAAAGGSREALRGLGVVWSSPPNVTYASILAAAARLEDSALPPGQWLSAIYKSCYFHMYLNHNGKNVRLYDTINSIGGFENFDMSIVEHYPCKNKNDSSEYLIVVESYFMGTFMRFSEFICMISCGVRSESGGSHAAPAGPVAAGSQWDGRSACVAADAAGRRPLREGRGVAGRPAGPAAATPAYGGGAAGRWVQRIAHHSEKSLVLFDWL